MISEPELLGIVRVWQRQFDRPCMTPEQVSRLCKIESLQIRRDGCKDTIESIDGHIFCRIYEPTEAIEKLLKFEEARVKCSSKN